MKAAVAMIALVLQAPVSLMRSVLSLVDDLLKVIESRLNYVIRWSCSDAKNKRDFVKSSLQNKRSNGYEA